GANECVWYAAAKAGVDSMVIGVSREVAKEGIRVNAITPGVIDTDIQPPGRIERVLPMLPMGRAGQANEVAEAILFLLSDAASYINGANLRVAGPPCPALRSACGRLLSGPNSFPHNKPIQG